jgi:homoserine dehydrogenase
VVGAFVRSRARARQEGIIQELVEINENALPPLECDVVVDALPGLEPSTRLVAAFLTRGIDVVSANKAAIAQSGPSLSLLAARHGASLRYSAAVGGSAPMIEAVRRMAADGDIISMTAILNGTCNFVLEQCERGMLLQEAVRDAQERGLAEADVGEDLSGRDAARKLRILARHAFGREMDTLTVEGIQEDALDWLLPTAKDGERLRLIATAAKLQSGRVAGHVRPEWIGRDHPLSNVTGEWNALAITCTGGETTVVSGRGAGRRWPTAEALIADLHELRREGQLK